MRCACAVVHAEERRGDGEDGNGGGQGERGDRVGTYLVPKIFYKIFQIYCHIKSYSTCSKYK